MISQIANTWYDRGGSGSHMIYRALCTAHSIGRIPGLTSFIRCWKRVRGRPMETATISWSRGRKRRGRRPANGSSIGRHIHLSGSLRWIIRARARFWCSYDPLSLSLNLCRSAVVTANRMRSAPQWWLNTWTGPDWHLSAPAELQWQRLHPLRRLCGISTIRFVQRNCKLVIGLRFVTRLFLHKYVGYFYHRDCVSHILCIRWGFGNNNLATWK